MEDEPLSREAGALRDDGSARQVRTVTGIGLGANVALFAPQGLGYLQ
jgi:hypothetical protein